MTHAAGDGSKYGRGIPSVSSQHMAIGRLSVLRRRDFNASKRELHPRTAYSSELSEVTDVYKPCTTRPGFPGNRPLGEKTVDKNPTYQPPGPSELKVRPYDGASLFLHNETTLKHQMLAHHQSLPFAAPPRSSMVKRSSFNCSTAYAENAFIRKNLKAKGGLSELPGGSSLAQNNGLSWPEAQPSICSVGLETDSWAVPKKDMGLSK
ncbi:hypothetical protein EDB83DRAFT_2317147 [Lactarius deliciosus]|nr:hypothetical protein EDB83DRAFT_2317147 [Lactarius deliciosus]